MVCRNPKMILYLIVPVLSGLLTTCLTAPGFSQAYCNITDVEVEGLSNGVQVTVKSDGRLEWDGRRRGRPRDEITYTFPNARLELDEWFRTVDKIPVSYIQLAIAPDAQQGVGAVMTVKFSQEAEIRATGSDDLQKFILTAVTESAVGEETPEKKPPGKAEEDKEGWFSVECKEGLFTVKAVNADIHEVVAEIAREGGINVAVNDRVKHKVSLNIVDAPPLVLLQGIAAGYGLALSTVGDVQMISEGVLKERDLATYNRSATASFPLTYLEAQAAASLLPNFLISYLHVNAEQNAIVVTAPSQMLEKIERDLKAVDAPPPLIMVDAVVVELSKTGEMQRGFAAEYASSEVEAHVDAGTGEVGYKTLDAEAISAGVGDTATLTATLKALVSSGAASIRANPRMAAANGKRAEIFIGAQRFIKVTYSSGGSQQERIEAVPVGVKLTVTPWTGGSGEITTNIRVEVSNISSLDPETGLPLLSTREAHSTVRTNDGETVVIGGLTQRQTETTRTKIPVLGDIPIIGPLFRSTSSSSVDTELLILLTPRLLSDRGRLTDQEEGESRSHFLQETDAGWEPTVK